MSGKTETERKPGVRIDGGKRRDLNKDRMASRMATLPEHAVSAETVDARKKASAKRDRTEAKAAAVGNDGARIGRIKVKLSTGRFSYQTMRAKPGTFEWRYGRDEQSPLFHAGSHLAILWERAGMTIASSANFLRGTSSGYSTGLAEGRAQAIDKLDGFRAAVGQSTAERLIDYCVLGLTTAQIALKDGAKERDMAPVLHQHLKDCARHFKFMGKSG